MRRDFKYHLSHVDNVLYAMAERGNRFFDETIRLSRILDLINADRIQAIFEREVVADTAAQIEAHTLELIDWMVAQEFKEWQDVTEYLGRHAARHSDQMIGPVNGIRGFEFNRQALLESVGQAAREAVATYDRNAEARALVESVQIAVAETAIVEVGAIGYGALLVKLLAVTVADITGLLAAGAVAALGSTSSRPSAAAPKMISRRKSPRCAPGSARRSPSSSRPSSAARWRASVKRSSPTPVSSRRSRRHWTRASVLARGAAGDGRAEGADRGDVTWRSAFAR